MPASERLEHGAGRLRRLRRVVARGAEDRAAEQVDARDIVDRERPEPGSVAAHEVLEAVADADDLEALVDGLDGDGGDDAVDARSRPAADEDAEPFRWAHVAGFSRPLLGSVKRGAPGTGDGVNIPPVLRGGLRGRRGVSECCDARPGHDRRVWRLTWMCGRAQNRAAAASESSGDITQPLHRLRDPTISQHRGRTVNATRPAVFRLGLLIAALVGFPPAGIAASVDGPLADYTITTWNENDGLPAGRIRSIAQDPDGYLWLATDAGLVRFDGVRFDTWSALGETRLPVGAVTALISARDRSLWLGVSGRMPLGRIKDGKLTLHGERDGFNGSYTLSLLEDHDGAIWAGTIQGLFRRAGGERNVSVREDGLGEGSVPAIYEDGSGECGSQH